MIADVSFRPLAPRRGPRFLLSTALALGLGLSLAGCKTSAEKADEYYQSGLQLLEQGDVDRAIVQFRNVFDIEGTHYEARKALADTYRSRGDTSQAYSQYLRLAEQYPDDLATRIALARMAFDSQQAEEFERHATRATEIAPQDPEVQVLDLIRRYRNATLAEDDKARASLGEEAARMAAGREDDAMLMGILLDRAATTGNLDDADRLTARLMELQPDNPQRYMQRLALLAERQDKPAIEAHLRVMIEKFPENTQAKADLVRFYMGENQPDKAEDFLRELADAAPADDPAPRADLVRFIEMQRGTEAARTELDRIIAEGGDPLLFRTLRAGFDFREGKQAEAIAEIRSVLEGVTEPSETSLDVKIQLARMLVETGDEAGGRQQVDEVLAQNASHPGGLKLRAAWDIQEDKVDDAVLALRSVLDQAPQDSEAMSLMADAYDRAGEADLARDYLSQAAAASNNAPLETMRLAARLISEERWRPAEDAILPALRQSPDNLDLLVALGRVYLSMPDLPRAEGVVARLREIGTDQARAAAEGLDLNRLATEEGEAAALDYLEQQANAADAGIGAKLSLIRAQLASGQAPAALAMAQDLVAAEPENRTARMALALAQTANDDLPAARAIFQALIQEQPDDLQPHMGLIRLASQEGDLDAALALTDQALAAIPDNPDLLWSKAGLVERNGDIDSAIAIYDQLYARDSSSVIIANNLASLLATWKSDDPAALARASSVARRLKDTDVPAFMDTYGWIQHLNGESAAALPYLEGAAEGLANDPIVQLHLGVVQAAVGKSDAARAQLEKGLGMLSEGQQGPSVAIAREALANLDAPAAPQQPGAAGTDGTTDETTPPAAPGRSTN